MRNRRLDRISPEPRRATAAHVSAARLRKMLLNKRIADFDLAVCHTVPRLIAVAANDMPTGARSSRVMAA